MTWRGLVDRLMEHLGYVRSDLVRNEAAATEAAATPVGGAVPETDARVRWEGAVMKHMSEGTARTVQGTVHSGMTGSPTPVSTGEPLLREAGTVKGAVPGGVYASPGVALDAPHEGHRTAEKAQPDNPSVDSGRTVPRFQRLSGTDVKGVSGKTAEQFQQRISETMRECHLLLYTMGFGSLPASNASEEMTEDGTGKTLNIWEVQPFQHQLRWPEFPSHEIPQNSPGVSHHPRLVILLSPNPDMELIERVGRYLGETNVQPVLIGGPEALLQLSHYAPDILKKSSQVTFLIEGTDIEKRNMAILNYLQCKIRDLLAVPVNLEYYAVPRSGVAIAPVSAADREMGTERGTTERETKETKPVYRDNLLLHWGVPHQMTAWKAERSGGAGVPPTAAENPSYSQTWTPRAGGMSHVPSRAMLPAGSKNEGYCGATPETRNYGPNYGSAEYDRMGQPPTEKQYRLVWNLLERTGFNLKQIDERYEVFGLGIGHDGMPVGEWLERLDRQDVSRLIDILQQIEQKQRKALTAAWQNVSGITTPESKASGYTASPAGQAMPPAKGTTGGEPPQDVRAETGVVKNALSHEMKPGIPQQKAEELQKAPGTQRTTTSGKTSEAEEQPSPVTPIASETPANSQPVIPIRQYPPGMSMG